MKRSMLGLAALTLVVGAFAGIGTSAAADCGDGGSAANHAGSCESAENQVTCGSGEATPLAVVSVTATGAEVCNDGSGAAPVQGRAGGDATEGNLYVDGDADNEAPANGWARVDDGGLHCSAEGQQSYNSGEGGPAESCGS